MDAAELRIQANETADRLAVLAATSPSLLAQDAQQQVYATAVRDVARWLSEGDMAPALRQLIDLAMEAAQRYADEMDAADGYGDDETPGGQAPG